jgi:hypothetical protein
LLRPHFIDRWKKQQKKDANDLDKIDPFFNDIIAGLSDEEIPIEEEPQKKQPVSNKRLSIKAVFIDFWIDIKLSVLFFVCYRKLSIQTIIDISLMKSMKIQVQILHLHQLQNF